MSPQERRENMNPAPCFGFGNAVDAHRFLLFLLLMGLQQEMTPGINSVILEWNLDP